jgi:myo-inositol 2-dehydrogenase/D-chiro-inositol 1-dehydrogenase
MSKPLNVAMAGLGRMGLVHAANLVDLQRRDNACRLVAVVEADASRARRFLEENRLDAAVFGSVEDLAASGLCRAAVVATPTDLHRRHASVLAAAGFRILLEKPLTGALEGDTEFAAELDRDYPDAVMLGFQRRFDAPLRYAKELIDSGVIGRVFKIYSALEDSGPPPDGYRSGGILPDMSVHNVDEILWLTGSMPRATMAIGSRLYGHTISTCEEDFDDALMVLWFDGMMAQVQVSRNHVSGYRVESIVFGERGQIQIGHFDQRPVDITVEAFGRRGATEPISRRTFSMGEPAASGPEFLDRFGPAYRAEAAAFLDCCRDGRPFPVTHGDGLRAQRVISAAMRGALGQDAAQSL